MVLKAGAQGKPLGHSQGRVRALQQRENVVPDGSRFKLPFAGTPLHPIDAAPATTWLAPILLVPLVGVLFGIPVIRVVLDNLNTHRTASLYETFSAVEARRVAKRLEFHHTPKHGSWLNMAEIEFSVLSRSCLRQRLPDEEALRREVQALVTERNAARATINWRFNTQDARVKLHRLYPFDSKHD